MTPAPSFAHLLHLSDARGTFEHARFAEPRPEHGYCTDDMARVVVVAAREHSADPAVQALVGLGLRFLRDAQGGDGRYSNRMDRRGRFTDRPTTEDCWGRSIWALGTVAAHTDDETVQAEVVAALERAAGHRSPYLRSMAFAVFGAAELLAVHPGAHNARELLVDAACGMVSSGSDRSWPWPEPRLQYANAVIPEAMIAAGRALDRPALVEQGLELLAWLLAGEQRDGHLSVTPVGGRGPTDEGRRFDQQPIEVAAIADACARAASVDASACWTHGVELSEGWFLGRNDVGVPMLDEHTGGGFDGLMADGPNRNQGAESTLALVSTLQRARQLAAAPR